MSLLNFNIRKVSQNGGAPCYTGLDFINHVECQTNVDITNGKLRIDGDKYTAYEIDKDLFSSLIIAPDFIKYERELTKENKLTNPVTLKKNEITRFMAVVKKNGSSIPQYTTIIKNHNQIKGEDGKKEDKRQEMQNPLKWNDNTNIEIKHTINEEEITKYKDIMNNGKKIAQMSVGKTNQYKNEATKSACTIFALGAIEFLLKNNNLNKLKYEEIWGENGIETGALEKYNKTDKTADHTTIEEAMKSFSTSLNNEFIFPPYTKGDFHINLENNEALIVVSTESISVTKKNNKYYVYDSHPHGGNSDIGNTKNFKGMDYKNSCICIFNEKENVNNFLNLRYPIPDINLDSLNEYSRLQLLEIDVEKITLKDN